MNENIFRAYDIRGIYKEELDEKFVYDFGLAFGTKLIRENKFKTLIGYDNRASSVSLFKSLAQGINDAGVDVINIGLVTTPMYYFSWHLLKIDSGIMITASHNPKEYNGLKFSFNGVYNAYGDDIIDFMNFIKKQDFEFGNGKIIEENIKDKYIDFLKSSITLGKKKLKVVMDAGNGTGSVVVNDIFKNLNIDYIPIYTDSDSDFPNHHPDPSVKENMKDLSDKVKEKKADIGFALDGDADRIGLVDEFGNMINIDHFMIIIIRNIINNLDDKRILFDVKCSKSLEDEIMKLGGIPVISRTGSSFLRGQIANDNILFGGELSGHVFFNDRFFGYDDGIYAALRMIEILSNTNKSVSELLKDINHYYSTTEIKMKVDDSIKFIVIDKIIEYCDYKNYQYLNIDGCKVIFEDGFALIRASNTGPDLTLRFEAKTEIRLNEIKNEFENKLKEILK